MDACCCSSLNTFRLWNVLVQRFLGVIWSDPCNSLKQPKLGEGRAPAFWKLGTYKVFQFWVLELSSCMWTSWPHSFSVEATVSISHWFLFVWCGRLKTAHNLIISPGAVWANNASVFIVLAVSVYIANGQKRKFSLLTYKKTYQIPKIKDVLMLSLSAALTMILFISDHLWSDFFIEMFFKCFRNVNVGSTMMGWKKNTEQKTLSRLYPSPSFIYPELRTKRKQKHTCSTNKAHYWFS